MFISKMSQKKQIFKMTALKKLLGDENSCVSLVPTTRLLALPPFFLNDMKSGILYLLNNMLKKYDRSLGGIVIGYQNIKVLMDENTGIIPMGTSETEVNISVEFYIFQPKIGSFLEGVINKKSNSHIGCLVHRYFNATILKPEDIDYDEWICQDLNVDDKIIFKVKDLDFTSLLPLIEGSVDDERFLNKVKSNLNRAFDLSSDIANNVKKRSPNKVFFPDNKGKYQNDKESLMEDNIGNNSLEPDSFVNIKKKKKKEKKLLNLSKNHNKTEKSESIDVKEVTSYTLSTEYNVNENYYSKKKKKKNDKRKQENGKNGEENLNVMGIFAKGDTSNSCKIIEKLGPIEGKDLNNFVKPSKIKEVKDKNKEEAEKLHSELNKTNQCLISNETEDEIFYSTQLDPSLPKKMKISSCSPISKNTSFEEKCQKRDLKSQAELNTMKKEKKHQKEKRKLGLSDGLELSDKKLKTSHSCSSENETSRDMINSDESISVVQTKMEEECRKQVSYQNKEEFNNLDKERFKEGKKKKEMLNLTQIRKGHENRGSGTLKNFEIDSLLDELRKQEIQRVKEELNISGGESCKGIKKEKMKVKKGEEETSKEKTDENSFSLKKIIKTPQIGTHGDEKKLLNMMDHPLKEEINRVEDEYNKFNKKGLKKEKKAKKAINTGKETSMEKTHNTLYEKLLNEAKSAMNLEENKSLCSPNTKESVKKKKKDLSNFTSFFTIKSSTEKKDQNSQKTKNYRETPEKYKNGSMYDATFTPEKVNFEKSLFSDSEQSNTSPTKREKKINGIKGDSVAQITSSNVTEAVKNGPGKEKERRGSNSEQEQESLYEKLLSEAKSLIQNSNECPLIKKKEKHVPIPKNKKNDCKTS